MGISFEHLTNLEEKLYPVIYYNIYIYHKKYINKFIYNLLYFPKFKNCLNGPSEATEYVEKRAEITRANNTDETT